MKEQELNQAQNLSKQEVMPPATEKPLKPRFKLTKWAIVFVAIALIVAATGAMAYVLNKNKDLNTHLTTKVLPSLTPASSVNSQVTSGPLFTGTLKPLNQNPGILVTSKIDVDNEKLGNGAFKVDYFEAGTYIQGKYKGYTRIVALEHSTSYQPGFAILFFATKDYKTFIMDSSYPYFNADNLSKAKIIKKDKLDFENPDIINLDSHFALNKIDYATTMDNNYKTFLLTYHSGFKELSSNYPYLKFYARPATINNVNQYIEGSTEVVVVDETGLAFFYNITTKDNIVLYNQDKQKVAQQDKIKKEFDDLWNAKYAELVKNGKGIDNGYSYTTEDEAKIVGQPYPSYSDYVLPPNLKINSSDIKNSSGPLYKKYDISFPQSCAGTNYTSVIKNISDNEMTKIGNTNSFGVYVITDKNHPLYKAEFKAKIYEASIFKEVNKTDPPTYDQYLSSYPLLFAKDYWNRWFALGEYDYQLLGGCGKPVIYLYPQKDTKVKINFQDPVVLDISIPSYNNGWNVLAHPNGILVDLQPQFTSCGKINPARVGSEYARDACNNNQYPYIYWAGKNLIRNYPRIDYGWIISRDNLNNFMNSKLTEIGLTKKEKTDMMEYWIPQMLSKNTPFYRIGFLTTPQMNEIAPMNITPTPDKLYRLFLDYLPLSKKPNVALDAPSIPKIVREGFTVIEWGGLLR